MSIKSLSKPRPYIQKSEPNVIWKSQSNTSFSLTFNVFYHFIFVVKSLQISKDRKSYKKKNWNFRR